jgi:non-specific serine/threonine protein kinase
MLRRREPAAVLFRDGLALAREMDDKEDIAWCLEGLAAVAAAEGNGERASLLLGAAGGLLQQMGADFKPFERKLHEATEARARGLAGDTGHAAALGRGAALPLADAVELALEAAPPGDGADTRTETWSRSPSR